MPSFRPPQAPQPAMVAARQLGSLARMIDALNQRMAQIIIPAHPAIDAIPPVLHVNKELLKRRPLDALLEMYAPVRDVVRDIIRRANHLSGKQVRTLGVGSIWRVDAGMDWAQPEDEALTPTERDLIRHIRSVNNLMILIIRAPHWFVLATEQVLREKAIDGWQAITSAVAEMLGVVNPTTTPREVFDDLRAQAERALGLGDYGISAGTIATIATYASAFAKDFGPLIIACLKIAGLVITLITAIINAFIAVTIAAIGLTTTAVGVAAKERMAQHQQEQQQAQQEQERWLAERGLDATLRKTGSSSTSSDSSSMLFPALLLLGGGYLLLGKKG